MLKIFLAEADSEFGRYTHRYRMSFHRVTFYPASGIGSELVFNSSAYENWMNDAEIAIRTHDAKLRGNNPAAAILGAKGGIVKSAAKKKSSAANGALGGRPQKNQ